MKRSDGWKECANETGSFDLIVLDIMLPGMDGLSYSPRFQGDTKENDVDSKS